MYDQSYFASCFDQRVQWGRIKVNVSDKKKPGRKFSQPVLRLLEYYILNEGSIGCLYCFFLSIAVGGLKVAFRCFAPSIEPFYVILPLVATRGPVHLVPS